MVPTVVLRVSRANKAKVKASKVAPKVKVKASKVVPKVKVNRVLPKANRVLPKVNREDNRDNRDSSKVRTGVDAVDVVDVTVNSVLFSRECRSNFDFDFWEHFAPSF
jgi:hypothetical protein